jgi:hypothetical protein
VAAVASTTLLLWRSLRLILPAYGTTSHMIQQDIYKLVAEYCNLEPVQDLLRQHKQDVPKDRRSDVLVSGENKDEIVGTNLRRAVETGIIPKADLYGLLQEAEENGGQHIFYYRPKNKVIAKECRDFERIGEAMWGKDWGTKMDFPRFHLIPSTYVWADFRKGIHGKPNDWIAKLYGHELQLKFTKEEALDDNHVIRHFERQEIRTVCLARWNNDDLLELRIPRSTSRKDQERRLAILWSNLSPALDQTNFDRWDLDSVRRALLREAESEVENYETGDKEFLDSESCRTSIVMHTQDENDAGYASEATQAAIQAHIDHDDSNCSRVIVYWKPNDENELKKNLRVQIGTRDYSNEVVVFSQASSRAIDYVTEQLRRFDA